MNVYDELYNSSLKIHHFHIGHPVLTISPSDGPELTKDVPENSTWDPCWPCWNDTLLLKFVFVKLELLALQKEKKKMKISKK